MSSLEMCRVCLSADVKIHSIRDTPLQVIYEGLTSYKLVTEDGRPETACYICFSQLQTCLRFQEKSLKTEEVLTQLFESGIELLQETVAILSRGKQHDYSVTPIESYNCPKPLAVKIEMKTDEEPPKNIKDEKSVQLDAALCRVCLVGVNTCSIGGTALETIFEKLTNTKLLVPGRPDTLCYICRCQLLKCLRLVSKAKRSENILTELFRNGIQLSLETVRVLTSKAKCYLEVAPTESVSYFAPGPICTVDLSRNNLLSKSYQTEDEEVKKKFDFKKPDLRFECGVCEYKCSGLKIFKNHLILHSLSRRFPCDICPNRYSTHIHLRQHKQSVHKIIYKCPKCPEKFIHISQFKLHMNIHSEGKVYKCDYDYCKSVFKNSKVLKRHKRKVHEAYRYPCDQCDVSFATKLLLKVHVIDAHAKFPYYVCDHCRKEFKDKSLLRKHMTTHIDRRTYKCEICDKCFKMKSCLIQHSRVHREKAFECDHCPRRFRDKPQLITHLKYHLNQMDFICNVCAKGFVDKHALKMHSKVHTKERYVCNLCKAEFYRKYFYDEHMQQHKTGFQKYMCNECGLSYPLQAQLRLHIYRHNRPKQQRKLETCSVCQIETKSLKNHMKIHKGLKPYACDICGKTFRSSGNRLVHQRSHSGLKEFGCDHCGKFFSKKSYLKRHISSHGSAKPYKCDVCDAAYSHRDKLTFHKRKHKLTIVFPCDICDASFCEKRYLDFHKRTHTKLVQFICDLCYKVHTDRTDFIQHLKSHRRNKLKCEVCNRSFGEMKILARHMKQHKLEKLVCPLCKAVMDRLKIRRHYQMVHGGVYAYACNICEEGSCMIEKVYNHYMRCHSKEDRYVCELCNNVYMNGGNLRKHLKTVHSVKY